MVSSVQNFVNNSCETAVKMGAVAVIGATCAWMFKVMHPMHAAVFSATTVLVTKVADPFFDKIFDGYGANNYSRFVGSCLSVAVGTAVSAAVATGLGFTVTFKAGLMLYGIVCALAVITMLGLSLAAAGVVS
jgi:hypothetical protein